MGKVFIVFFTFTSCHSSFVLKIQVAKTGRITGTEFYKSVAGIPREERETFALKEMLEGNIPSFLKRFSKIRISISDSNNKSIDAYFFVMPDYLAVGTDNDFARIPLTPKSAQIIADSFHCFLPTRKIADDVYKHATVKLEPVPLFAFRDSSVTFWHHHLIIEGQRKQQKGLIAGIKKDVVISSKLIRDEKKNRVAIYGWHKPGGNPIQPLYTGHVDSYVDYSHGIRLIYRTIWVNGKAMDYTDVMKDNQLRALLCDEVDCDVYRY